MKRCAIYCYWNEYGELNRFAVRAINSLKEIASRVVVVVNGEINQSGRDEITGTIGAELIVRPNEGYDFSGYKAAIEYIGYDELKPYDEFVILNSSVYGPIFPLSNIFGKMADRADVDFWGITRNKEEFPEHIQSYFLVFKNSLLKDDAFKSFWDELPNLRNRKEAIALAEAGLTPYFCQKGFSYDTVIERDYDEFYSDTLDGSLRLVTSNQNPFIKRNIFSVAHYEMWAFIAQSDPGKIFKFLDDQWKDDILEDLCLNSKQSQWKIALGNSWIIDPPPRDISVNNKKTGSCAIVVYVWFEENINLLKQYILNMPPDASVYIVSAEESILSDYKKAFASVTDRKIEYRIQPNRGRNESCYWVTCRDVIASHDYVCLVHDKKITQLKPLNQGLVFFRYQLENLLANRHYVHRILENLEKNPRVGLIQPPLPVFGPWAGINVLNPKRDPNHTSGNMESCRQFFNLRLPLDADLPYPVGGSFWIRSKAFQKILDKHLTYEDFPEEPLPVDFAFNHSLERLYPLIAQDAGFITVDAMTADYAITHKGHLEYFTRLNQDIFPFNPVSDEEKAKRVTMDVLRKVPTGLLFKALRKKFKNRFRRNQDE